MPLTDLSGEEIKKGDRVVYCGVPGEVEFVADPLANPTAAQVQRPIQYVQLSPGQTAPPGATVIAASAPTPITLTVTVPAPAAQTPVVIKTTASGKVIP